MSAIMSEEKKSDMDKVTLRSDTLRRYFPEVVYAQADGADHHQAAGCVAETAAEKSGTIKGCLEAVQERGRQKILIEKDLFGTVRDKVKIAQERLKAFEPSEGYYVADSGGKDSACVLALCKMAGVRFDSHYNITTVDPPELVKFVREAHPETELVRPQMTMRELIVKTNFRRQESRDIAARRSRKRREADGLWLRV